MTRRYLCVGGDSKAAPVERYSVTKLLDLFITLELACLYPLIDGRPEVIMNTVAPGFCKSELLTRELEVLFILKLLEFLTTTDRALLFY
jgi:hypothetical protein